MALRPAILRIHLILGLVAGLLLSVVTVSGASVIIRPELDWLHADTAGMSAERSVTLDSTVAALRERWPEARVQRLIAPAGTGQGDEWWLRDGKGTKDPGDDESWKAFTDPGTGRLLGDTRDSTGSDLLAWLARFHHNLWLGEIGGMLVGSAGLCLLGFIVTGLWLWWPGFARLGASLRLRLGKAGLIRQLDLHTVSGVFGTPLLIVIAVTGCMFEFRWMRAAVHYGLGGGEADSPPALRPRPPETAVGAGPDSGRKLGFTRAAAVAQASASGTVLAITPPRPGRGDAPWTVLLDFPGNTGSLSGVLVQVAPDGTAGLVLDPRRMSPGGWVNNQHWGLHTGTWAGAWSKTLYLLVGLLPPLLMVTGLGIWLHRRAQAAGSRAGS